jgi:transposase-like protein
MHPGAPLKAPPFCPNPNCAFHCGPTASWRYKRYGTYERRSAPYVVQRYKCVHCAREFSDQTFRPTYYLKRPELLLALFHALVSCTGFRQFGRANDCHHSTAMRQAQRLGRHCLLFHEMKRPKGPLTEPIVFDGLRNFEYSQYHPSEFHIVVGKGSHFVHGFTHSELKRMGKMTAKQKRENARIQRDCGTPPKHSVRDEVANVLAIATAGSESVVLHSDEHYLYPRALKRLKHLKSIEHYTTSAKAVRHPSNPLFPVNLMDLLVRHSMSSQKRETIAFSKTIASAVSVMWVMVAWRNYVKHASEQRQRGSPAMRLKVCAHRYRPARLLKWRLFPSKIELPKAWLAHYYRLLKTRQVPLGRRHELVYAV